MLVGKICNREVVFVEPDASIAKAARLMREHHVGGLVVVQEKFGKRVPIGIITDRPRDRGYRRGRGHGRHQYRRHHERPAGDTREGDDLLQTLKMMRAHGIRRLPSSTTMAR